MTTEEPRKGEAQGGEPAPQAAGSPMIPPTATGAAQGQERPEWLPEAFWDAEKREPRSKEFSEHISGLEKFKSDAEAARKGLPATPDDYSPDLGGVKLPPGVELNTKDPLFAEFRKVAHEAGLPQAAFGEMTRIFGRSVAEQKQRTDQQIADLGRQFDKYRNEGLGENGASRINDLGKWLAAQSDNKSETEQLQRLLKVAEPFAVKFLEGYKGLLLSQGASRFTQSGRVTEQGDGKPDNWAKMSAVDRRTYQLDEQRARAQGPRS